MIKHLFLFLIALTAINSGNAQSAGSAKIKGWHLAAPEDGFYGIALNKAYDLVKNRKSHKVIVAVIDSGVDTLHEDIKPVLWVNKRELPGNGIDDDKNGYRDDIHGWNFDGGANGENLTTNSHEIARVYHGWRSEFEGKRASDIKADRQFMYSQWKRSEKLLRKQYEEYQKNIPGINNTYEILNATNHLIMKHLGTTEFTISNIRDINTSDSLGWSIDVWKNMFSRIKDTSLKNIAVMNDVEAYRNYLLNNKKRFEELPVDIRGALTKDRYDDINDRGYGNHNLQTGSGNHGTHVAGIIGAIRNNQKGGDGIADNVELMILRAVPGGDEHDKDVALAIRYAVDNGAQVINMSFGKPVSPYKHFVDDAIRYAALKNVLLVHGAGNDGLDLDDDPFYPNAVFLDGTVAKNMLTVGASSDPRTGQWIADFSNYSDQAVDIFAPGVYIYSTVTGNGYEALDGTSMASPVVAGVAALLKSYFPSLTPEQIIDLLMKSGTEVKEAVNVPGEKNKKASLSSLSKSGKIVNAYEAMKLALKLYGNTG